MKLFFLRIKKIKYKKFIMLFVNNLLMKIIFQFPKKIYEKNN